MVVYCLIIVLESSSTSDKDEVLLDKISIDSGVQTRRRGETDNITSLL